MLTFLGKSVVIAIKVVTILVNETKLNKSLQQAKCAVKDVSLHFNKCSYVYKSGYFNVLI